MPSDDHYVHSVSKNNSSLLVQTFSLFSSMYINNESVFLRFYVLNMVLLETGLETAI